VQLVEGLPACPLRRVFGSEVVFCRSNNVGVTTAGMPGLSWSHFQPSTFHYLRSKFMSWKWQ
jgi:hypothetical protein